LLDRPTPKRTQNGQNQRRIDGFSSYLLLESTLEKCLRELIKKPANTLHLYEIHTAPQLPLVQGVCLESMLPKSRGCRIFSNLQGTETQHAGFR
jgi:hypothetical protein